MATIETDRDAKRCVLCPETPLLSTARRKYPSTLLVTGMNA
ncbi:hypothetical protein ABH944_005732 [Caballeronia udeis]|jgi:hypothetical protein|uniref:Uncharacterized protein n=1 Tax=Caballeronia udeis TaxID=1232866 RepID=A0ABW8MPN5_9BURK